MKYHSFTYIIGYRHKPDRIHLLKRVLDWINGFNGVEVILVEQDKHSKIKHLNLKCKHIFIKNENDYNRSWAFNVGAKFSTSDLIVFGDSDLIMDPNLLIDGLKETEKYDVVSPYNVVVDLEPSENNLPFEKLLKISRPGRGETDNQKINLTGGIVIFKKDSIFKIGGWSELFEGWGGEDDFQTIKVKKLLTWKEMSGKCYHLYHNKQEVNPYKYQRTLQILNQLASLSDTDLQKHIMSTYQTLGLKNKYDI